MPYRLTGATQTCQWGLDEVLKQCKDCVDNCVDDCTIFWYVWLPHHRCEMCPELTTGSKIYTKRFQMFLWYELNYTPRFWIFREGSRPSTEKAHPVADWPTSRSSREVRSFLGLANSFTVSSPTLLTLYHPSITWQPTMLYLVGVTHTKQPL